MPSSQIIYEHDNEDESAQDDSSQSSDSIIDLAKDDQGPLPEPPLFTQQVSQKPSKHNGAIIDISRENWDEGTDTKQKAYQRLRLDKNKMFEENKIWKKYTSIFKGLKRCHQRAKKPNKITEYEVPRDPTKFNKKIDDFDPSILLEMEYEKDELKKKEEDEKIWGPSPSQGIKKEGRTETNQDEVKVTHLEDLSRVKTIFEELSQMDNPEDQKYKSCSLFSIKEQDPFSTSNYLDKFTPASHNPMKKTDDLTERTYKARLSMYEQEREKKEQQQRKRINDMLRNMQELDNHKLRGPRDDEVVQFITDGFSEISIN